MIRIAALASLLVLSALAASSSPVATRHPLRLPATPGVAPLVMVGSRGAGAVPGKLDGVLADLVRHAPRVRMTHALADLHALSPAAHFARDPWSGVTYVAIDATTRGDPRALVKSLTNLGLVHPAVYRNDVGGLLPVSALARAGAAAEVVSLRAAMSHRRAVTGPVATQGDFAQQSSAVRAKYPKLTGAGVAVGILSDSFDCYSVYAAPGSGVPVSGAQGYASNGFSADYATDVATGALPANITVVEEPNPNLAQGATAQAFPYGGECGYQYTDSNNEPLGLPLGDEGRAMAQIVYAVAPGAQLLFRTGEIDEADFAAGIEQLAAAPYNAKVIMDDLGYFDEPFFQDGIIVQAIDKVQAGGVTVFSAAGNNQETPAYVSDSPSFSTTATLDAQTEKLLNFDTTGQTTVTSLPINIPALFPGDFVAIVIEWDQPYVTGAPASGGATSQIDVCLTGPGTAGSPVIIDYDAQVQSCSGLNALGSDPYQIMIVANPANATGNSQAVTVNLQIGLGNGTAGPGKLIVAVEDDGQGSTISPVNGVTPSGPMLQGHPGAVGAIAMGAAAFYETPLCGVSPAVIERYSAWGGEPILFDSSGTRLTTPQVRSKPDVVGPDGVNDTFLGYTLASAGDTDPSTVSQCGNNASYPNFFGTSAATPHAGAIAALMLQANSALTPSDIADLMHMTAAPLPVTAAGAPSDCQSGKQPNPCSGYGFLQASAIFDQLAPGTPTLTLAQSSITAGSSTTISWSSPIASSCTASGSWSGALAASGSQTITQSTAGSFTYGLTCSNASGSSATPASVKLTVSADPPSGGGGGGGGLGGGELAGLLALVTWVAAGGRRRAQPSPR